MSADNLKIDWVPEMESPKLVLGFSGWMDGGQVSTGTVEYLIESLMAKEFASIDPEPFYIYSFPGSMEMSSLFRPHARIEGGVIHDYDVPDSVFYCDKDSDLILFLGKEPNLAWKEYAENIFNLCEKMKIEQMYFIGSVAGLMPHTRESRISCSVSRKELKSQFEEKKGVRFSNYEGPASFITYMTVCAKECGIDMINLVAEIPAYVQSRNSKCIATAVGLLVDVLDLGVELGELREISDSFEKKLSEAVEGRPELSAAIHKLERDYDDQLSDTEVTDLKTWLERYGLEAD
jgi:hypothetical protein